MNQYQVSTHVVNLEPDILYLLVNLECCKSEYEPLDYKWQEWQPYRVFAINESGYDYVEKIEKKSHTIGPVKSQVDRPLVFIKVQLLEVQIGWHE